MEWYVLKNGKYFKTVNSPREAISLIDALRERDIDTNKDNKYSYTHMSEYNYYPPTQPKESENLI